MSVRSVWRAVYQRDGNIRLRAMAALNLGGLLYFLMMAAVVTNLGMYRVIGMTIAPHTRTRHYYWVYFLFIQVMGNFYHTFSMDTSIKTLTVQTTCPSVTGKNTSFCRKCRKVVPLRSHHCNLCGVCILKRDHHCFFMCVCIGYYNQKYFIIFCFYQLVAGLYATILLAKYLNKLYDVQFYGPQTLLMLLPESLAQWVMAGGGDPQQMVLIGIFYGSLVGSLAAAGFLFWQISIVLQGQTTHEARCGDERHSQSLYYNWKDTFGPYWYISWFVPIPLPQCGDGTYAHPPSKLHVPPLHKRSSHAKTKRH